jgi:hypothetical protein
VASAFTNIALHKGEQVRGRVSHFSAEKPEDLAYTQVALIAGRIRNNFLVRAGDERSFAETLRGLADDLDHVALRHNWLAAVRAEGSRALYLIPMESEPQ